MYWDHYWRHYLRPVKCYSVYHQGDYASHMAQVLYPWISILKSIHNMLKFINSTSFSLKKRTAFQAEYIKKKKKSIILRKQIKINIYVPHKCGTWYHKAEKKMPTQKLKWQHSWLLLKIQCMKKFPLITIYTTSNWNILWNFNSTEIMEHDIELIISLKILIPARSLFIQLEHY